jgi:hypothetical protein
MADPQALFLVAGIVVLALIAFVLVVLARAPDEPPREGAKKAEPEKRAEEKNDEGKNENTVETKEPEPDRKPEPASAELDK